MFNYSLQTKIILVAVLVVLISTSIWLTRQQNSRASDLQVVSAAKILANSVESYYDQYQSYPASDKVSAATIQAITNNGLNQGGDKVFYRAQAWARPAFYQSDGTNYVITFDLDNSWQVWSLGWSGGSCQITKNVELSCRSK